MRPGTCTAASIPEMGASLSEDKEAFLTLRPRTVQQMPAKLQKFFGSFFSKKNP
jgi:hypothetical protein